MKAVKLSRRLLALISFFAVSLGLFSSLAWAQGWNPGALLTSLQSPSRPDPGGAFRPGQALVPLRQPSLLEDGRLISPQVPVRSTEGVTGFGSAAGSNQRPSTRVTVGSGGGAATGIREQVVNITLRPPNRLTDEVTPFWTSDEQFIFYAALTPVAGGVRYQLYRIDANAALDPAQPIVDPLPTEVRITGGSPAADNSDFLFPTLNANSTRIAFIRSVDGRPIGDPLKRFDLYVTDAPSGAANPGFIELNPASGRLVSLTAGRTFRTQPFTDVQRPAWLGTGDIVFAARLNGSPNYHIFSVNVSSGIIFQLTDGGASELNPAVSPRADFIAFDSNAAAYTPGGVPRQEAIIGNPAAATGLGPTRNIFIMTTAGGNPVPFTTAPGTTNVQPAWSSNTTNPQINPTGQDIYIAFSSNRRDLRADPADPSRITGFDVAGTNDIYYVRTFNRTTGAVTPEGPPGDETVNPARKLETADPNYEFNDQYPAWPPFRTIFRLVHQSDRTGTLRRDLAGQPFVGNFTKTPGQNDLFVSTLTDITAPTLIRYDTSRADGEVVHINQGGAFNPSTAASVRDPRTGVQPGGTLFFTVRVEDREAGMQPEKSEGGRGAVFLVFKNPNSKYQPGSGNVERKEFRGTAYTYSTGMSLSPYTFVNNQGVSINYGFEYECQAISAFPLDNPAKTGYFYHNQTIGTAGIPGAVAPGPLYTASVNDALAFSGVTFPPQDGGEYTNPTTGTTTTTPAIWLPLTRLPQAQQDSQGGILYGAAWTLPATASDWHIDVVAYDNAVNPYDVRERFNWIIYDNVWGFSTLSFSGVENLLVVSDYTLGQKFNRIRFGEPSAVAFNNLLPLFYGAESYFTDVGRERFPSTSAAANFNLAAPFATTGGTSITIGPPNTLGVNSYTDALNDDGTRVDGLPYPESQRYAIWRILCRGPVPSDVLTAYLPRPEQDTPPDLRVNESAPRRVRSADRMVIWTSPFTSGLTVGPGTILDQNTQNSLTNFVTSGGRLFISGQNIGFALTRNGTINNAFFTNILKARFASDDGGATPLTPTLIGGQDNSVATEPWTRAQHNYRRFPGQAPWVYDPPGGGPTPITNNLPLNNANARRDASMTAPSPGINVEAFGANGRLDVITPLANAYTQFNYPNGTGIITSRFDVNNDNVLDSRDGQVAYGSMGFESVSYDWYQNNNIAYNLGRRAEIMHNITCSFRTGTIAGQVVNASQGGQPLSDVLVRAVAVAGNEPQAAIATAATNANGQFQLVGLKPDNYTIFAYRRGFTIQQTFSATVHGGYRSQANVTVTEAPPGTLAGRIFRGGNRNTPPNQRVPLQGIEVQLRARNVNGSISVLRGISGADGSYNIPGVPIGLYQVIANPRNVDEAGRPIPEADPRFNRNFNPNFTTVVVANANQPEIELGAGVNITAQSLVEIRSGETTIINFFLTAPPVTLRGRVIDRDTRSGIPGATVIARRTTGATTVEIGRTTTDAQGNYSFANVTEGPLTIEASAPGYATNSVTFTVTNPGNTGNVANAPVIELTRLPPGSLSGLVTDAGTGQPVTGATVQLFFQGQPAPSQTAQTGAAQRAPDGYVFNYRFDRVEAGSYTVRVLKDDLTASPASLNVAVNPGAETRNVNFRLLPLQIYGAGLQLISLPYDYTGRESRSVFGLVAGTPEYNAFTIAEWTGQEYNIGPAIPLRLGRGYFVRFAAVTTVQARGRAVPERSVAVPLPAGWSLIGHPFDPIVGDLSLATDVRVVPPGQDPNGPGVSMAEAVAAGLVRDVVFSYTGSNAGSQYVQGSVLKPWFGYWFRAFQPVTLKINRPAGR